MEDKHVKTRESKHFISSEMKISGNMKSYYRYDLRLRIQQTTK